MFVFLYILSLSVYHTVRFMFTSQKIFSVRFAFGSASTADCFEGSTGLLSVYLVLSALNCIPRLSKITRFTENILASISGWQKGKYFIKVCCCTLWWPVEEKFVIVDCLSRMSYCIAYWLDYFYFCVTSSSGTYTFLLKGVVLGMCNFAMVTELLTEVVTELVLGAMMVAAVMATVMVMMTVTAAVIGVTVALTRVAMTMTAVIGVTVALTGVAMTMTATMNPKKPYCYN